MSETTPSIGGPQDGSGMPKMNKEFDQRLKPLAWGFLLGALTGGGLAGMGTWYPGNPEAKSFSLVITQNSTGPRTVFVSTNFVAKEDKEAALAWLRGVSVMYRSGLVNWRDQPEYWLLIAAAYEASGLQPVNFEEETQNWILRRKIKTLVNSGFLSYHDDTKTYTVTDAGWELIINRLRQFKLI